MRTQTDNHPPKKVQLMSKHRHPKTRAYLALPSKFGRRIMSPATTMITITMLSSVHDTDDLFRVSPEVLWQQIMRRCSDACWKLLVSGFASSSSVLFLVSIPSLGHSHVLPMCRIHSLSDSESSKGLSGIPKIYLFFFGANLASFMVRGSKPFPLSRSISWRAVPKTGLLWLGCWYVGSGISIVICCLGELSLSKTCTCGSLVCVYPDMVGYSLERDVLVKVVKVECGCFLWSSEEDSLGRRYDD